MGAGSGLSWSWAWAGVEAEEDIVPRPMDLPAEVWADVFARLRRPAHLLNAALVCRTFYELALRPLYRDVVFRDPRDFIGSLPSWQTPSLALVPQSLVLSVSAFNDAVFSAHDPSVALVGPDGSVSPAHAGLSDSETATRPPQFFASSALFDRIAAHVGQFSLLTELVFHNAHLPPLIYDLIKSFPRLESLFFYDCFLPAKSKDLTALNVLPSAPITKLALWNVRNEMDHPAASLRYALRLATIPTIRVLHVDWTPESAAFLNTTQAKAELPPIAELAVRMPAQYAWPADINSARTRLIDPLILFLNSVHTVTRLFVANRLPFCALNPNALPLLSTFSGPHTCGLDIATYRNLTHIEFRDDDKKATDVIAVLPDLKEVAPGLESLSLPLRKWDEEIMYPTTDFFPRLKTLKILYDEGHPSEVRIVLIYRVDCPLNVYVYTSTPSSAWAHDSCSSFQTCTPSNSTTLFSATRTRRRPLPAQPHGLPLSPHIATSRPRPTLKTSRFRPLPSCTSRTG